MGFTFGAHDTRVPTRAGWDTSRLGSEGTDQCFPSR